MLVIRFQRVGKKSKAAFRIVLQDKHRRPGGKVLELLGHYNPHTKDKQLQAEKIKFWLAKGAQTSATIHNLLVDAKIIEGEKIKAWKPKKNKKKEADAAKASPVESAPVKAKEKSEKEVKEVKVEKTDEAQKVEAEPKETVQATPPVA